MRRFIRHPAGIPIEVDLSKGATADQIPDACPTLDVSLGGLSFRSPRALDPGSLVSVRIALVSPPFESDVRIVWCREAGAGYKVGAVFLNLQDQYRARMVEQICHIETYRRRMFDMERRSLSSEEAAIEWISKFAAHFPGAETVRRI